MAKICVLITQRMGVIRRRIFQDKLPVPSSRAEMGTDRFFALEDVADSSSRNVGKELPQYAA